MATSPISLSVQKPHHANSSHSFILLALACLINVVLTSMWYHSNLLSSDIQGAQINEAACDLAREVANEGGALVAGCVSKTPCYMTSHSETEVKAIFKKQMDDFLKKDIDFFIVEV